MLEVSREDEIRQVTVERPHVVILGAGASRAAFPNGDRNGHRLPLMADFADIVPIGKILTELGLPIHANFEETYSLLSSDPALFKHCRSLESTIFEYFDSLRLPDEVTLFDQLLLSLRKKDVVATFNWDPFLIQAARRNPVLNGRLPDLCFLHGNVAAGFCATDRVHGVRGARCSRCGHRLEPSRLLFPVSEKNYESDPAINDQWKRIKMALRDAFMVTIFGYSAPTSDQGAITLLREAWGTPSDRSLEQFEMLDVREEEALRLSWTDFIHTHHYEVHSSFSESWIFSHPRRSGEAYWNQYLEASFIEDNPLPPVSRLSELWAWLQPLFEAEGSVSDRDDTA